MTLKVTLIPGRELGPDLVDRWRELQRSNPELASPYFCPEFTEIIAAVRDDVEVAIIEETGNIAAFFPFQRGRDGVGVPVGGLLSDYQGLICGPEFLLDPRTLVRHCGLVAWDFDHLLASQESFIPFHSNIEPSPQIDLSQGHEAYLQQRLSSRSLQASIRGIQRYFGPLHFVGHDANLAALQNILVWKSQQYCRTGVTDLFSKSWIRTAVERVHAMQTEGLSGTLSLLYAGDRLAAGHLTMRAGSIWHFWFPAYNQDMAKYSPGIILTLKMAEYAPSIGVQTIDFGKGINERKRRFMNASVPIASGSVALPSWRSIRRGTRQQLRSLFVKSPLDKPARAMLRALRQRAAP